MYNNDNPSPDEIIIHESNDDEEEEEEQKKSDSYFIKILNANLEKIRSNITLTRPIIHDDSPFDSNNNSDSDNEQLNSDSMNGSFYTESINHDTFNDKPYNKLSSYQIERSVEKYYYESENTRSTELDVLITYAKGQKNLYISAKNATQFKLNCLLIPSLLITSAIAIFAPFIQSLSWSGGFFSGLNAITTLFISLANYLKLESSVELFHITANQYDQIETSLEFVSSKLLFINTESEKSRIILHHIQEVETKIGDIKHSNLPFVPDEVKSLFPIICNINIFSFIKRMEIYRKTLVIKLKDVKNEIRYIIYMRKKREFEKKEAHVQFEKEEARLLFLTQLKEKTKEELIQCKSAYGDIDEVFTKEIKQSQLRGYFFGFCKRSNIDKRPHRINPILQKYIY